MSKFDEWFDSEYSNYGYSYKKLYDENHDLYGSEFVNDRYDAYKAGAQSKQAEIDDHIKRRLELAKEKQVLINEIDELRKRIDEALKAMEAESANSWGLWKEKADMYEQGASDAYERSYWILKGTTNER